MIHSVMIVSVVTTEPYHRQRHSYLGHQIQAFRQNASAESRISAPGHHAKQALNASICGEMGSVEKPPSCSPYYIKEGINPSGVLRGSPEIQIFGCVL
jgi:hypothetical protein